MAFGDVMRTWDLPGYATADMGVSWLSYAAAIDNEKDKTIYLCDLSGPVLTISQVISITTGFNMIGDGLLGSAFLGGNNVNIEFLYADGSYMRVWSVANLIGATARSGTLTAVSYSPASGTPTTFYQLAQVQADNQPMDWVVQRAVTPTSYRAGNFGLTFDGLYYYTTTYGSAGGATTRINRHDPYTFEIVQAVNAPVTDYWSSGIAYTGGSLLLSIGGPTSLLYQIALG